MGDLVSETTTRFMQRGIINPLIPGRLICFLLFTAASFTSFSAGLKPTGPAPGFFGLTNLRTVEIQLSPSEWAQLQKGKRGGPENARVNQERNYVYAHADLRVDNRVYPNVGIRFKGSGTMAGAMVQRWPFRIDLDKYVDGQRIDGAGKISFNNNYYDPSYLREALSYQWFQSFGVPAPRTCFIKLFLTVPGKYDRKYLGLYTAAESVETPFLKAHFGSKSGLLLKPDYLRGGNPTPAGWNRLAATLHPKTDGTELQRKKIAEFFTLLNGTNSVVFREKIEEFINLDEYLRFVVVNVALVNQDSYLGMGKNYYIYLDDKTNRLNWLPWDLDLSMAGFFYCGTAAQRIEFSIDRPSSIKDRLIRQVFGVPEFREKYHVLMREFLEGFKKEKVFAQIDELSGIIRESVEEDGWSRPGDFERSLDGRTPVSAKIAGDGKAHRSMIEPGLKHFVEKRIESIEAQLDGKREGVRTGFMQVEPW